MDDYNHAQFRRKEYAPTNVGHDILQTTSTSEEALDLVVGTPQLGGVHPEDDPTLGTDWSADNRSILVFLCASPVLTRRSVNAADGG